MIWYLIKKMHTEIEQIMGRQVYSGKVLYLTRWKGQPKEQATWESVKVLKNVKSLIKQYNKKHKIQPNIDEELGDDQPIKKKKEKTFNKIQPRKRGRPKKNKIIFEKQDIKIEKKEQIFYQDENQQEFIQCDNQVVDIAPKSVMQILQELDQVQINNNSDIEKICSTEQASSSSEKNVQQIVQIKTELTEKGTLTAQEQKQIIIVKIIKVRKGSDGKAIYTIQENFGRQRQETTQNLLVKCPRLLINFLQSQIILKQRGKQKLDY